MKKTKKTWKRPQLIILERATPEEIVLQACKGDGSRNPVAGANLCQKSSCKENRPS
mgnify:CR=1 FL=1